MGTGRSGRAARVALRLSAKGARALAGGRRGARAACHASERNKLSTRAGLITEAGPLEVLSARQPGAWPPVCGNSECRRDSLAAVGVIDATACVIARVCMCLYENAFTNVLV